MLLEVNELTKEFKRGSVSFRAVDEAKFSIDRGEFVSIVGRSGSGKSTLLNLISGLLSPSGGSVVLDGKEISQLNDRDGSNLRNAGIGYVPQGNSILSNLSIIDNIRLPFYLQRRTGKPDQRAMALLEQMGIVHLAECRPAHLSGGELKRAVIARALINSPSLLIADEPTSDLDLETTKVIMELFTSLSAAGTTILVVTHEPVVSVYCGRTLNMEGGKLTEKK